MESTKTFTVAGVSTHNGVVTARFANDLTRTKVLEKNGHTNVRLVVLDGALTKEAALAVLRSHADFQDAEAQAAFVIPEAKVVEAKAPKVKSSTAKAKIEEVLATKELQVDFQKGAPAVDLAKGDTVKAKNKKTMKETFAKIKQREAEEAEEAKALRQEERDLELNGEIGGRRKHEFTAPGDDE